MHGSGDGWFLQPTMIHSSSVSQDLPAIHLLNMHPLLFLLMLLVVEFLNTHKDVFSSFLPFFMRETISGAGGKKRSGSEGDEIFKCISHLTFFFGKWQHTALHFTENKNYEISSCSKSDCLFLKKKCEGDELILKWGFYLFYFIFF